MKRKCSYRFMLDMGEPRCRLITIDIRRKRRRETGNTGFYYVNREQSLRIARMSGCSFIVRLKGARI